MRAIQRTEASARARERGRDATREGVVRLEDATRTSRPREGTTHGEGHAREGGREGGDARGAVGSERRRAWLISIAPLSLLPTLPLSVRAASALDGVCTNSARRKSPRRDVARWKRAMMRRRRVRRRACGDAVEQCEGWGRGPRSVFPTGPRLASLLPVVGRRERPLMSEIVARETPWRDAWSPSRRFSLSRASLTMSARTTPDATSRCAPRAGASPRARRPPPRDRSRRGSRVRAKFLSRRSIDPIPIRPRPHASLLLDRLPPSPASASTARSCPSSTTPSEAQSTG